MADAKETAMKQAKIKRRNSKEHEEAWMEDCQEIYLKLSADTNDFLKEQLVLSQSAHEKGIAGTSVTVSTPEETTENFASQDEIHTKNTANQ